MDGKLFEMKTKPGSGKITGSPTAYDWAGPAGMPIPKTSGKVVLSFPKRKLKEVKGIENISTGSN